MGHKAGIYEKYIKRMLDFVLSLGALIVLSPVILILTVVGAVIMKGNPFFSQPRPGKNEIIFKLIKFRSMTCEKDKYGNLLPDEQRMTTYGKLLRLTSLDEIPELWNILKGDMSIVGPRPFLVRDCVFFSEEQHRRHSVRPGLTGLAQVNGRNNITWERKFEYDLKYIDEGITFVKDFKIVLKTVVKVLEHSDVARDGMESDIDFGDWLLMHNEINKDEYDCKQEQAKKILEDAV